MNGKKNRVFDNILKTIGDTPIVKLNRVVEGLGAHFYGKVEFFNPGGSIKDRIGWYLIEDAERRGVVKPGGTIVECTSGNTGVGLAMAAAIKGYKCVFVLPDKMSNEKIRALRAFGARVVVTPTAVEPEDPRSYYSVAKRIAAETPNAVWINQYDNLANRELHYKTTGPEILEQMPDVDVIVAGIGTGGTVCGIGKYMREHKPSVKIVAVDPVGSMVYDMYTFGKAVSRPKTYKIEGIGEDFIPKNYDFSVIDAVVQVEDKESHLMTRDLLTKEGLYIGVSCASAVVGAMKYFKTNEAELKGKNILVILPDRGDRYLSKVYDDDWMREAGFLDHPSMGTVSDLLLQQKNASAGNPRAAVIMAKQTDKVSTVIELLRDRGISQVPIADVNGWIKGVVTEGALLTALYEGRAKPGDTVERLANPSVEFVSPQDPIEKISKMVTSGKTALVSDPLVEGKISGIITMIDLLTYMGNRV